MILIEYPDPLLRFKTEKDRKYIFDSFRKKWVVLTPEEWVRQHFLHLLVHQGVPESMMAVEKEFRMGELNKRFDILVYDRLHQPWLMVECKAPEVTLDQQVLDQLLRYHSSIPVPYLLVTNGPVAYAWAKQPQGWIVCDAIPVYGQ